MAASILRKRMFRRLLNTMDVLCAIIILVNVFPNSFLVKQRSRKIISVCNTDASPLQKKMCDMEASLVFFNPYSNPVIVKDVSYQRYYATRDLQGWTIAFNNRSMHVVERSMTSSVSSIDFSVFICLTLSAHDKYCIKSKNIKNLEQWQRYSQFYGLRNILWRKDSFCWSMKEALNDFKKERDFIFPCWVLPNDIESLEREMRAHPNQPYIVKPDNKGEGHGIFVVHSYREILDKGTIRGHVVQPFLKDPFLIDGFKFDFRTYVLVTSITPLRAYFYKEGLVRFAAERYDPNNTQAGKEQKFLTNTSINKKFSKITSLTWTYEKLKHWFVTHGYDGERIFESIKEVIVYTLLAVEYKFLKNYQISLEGYDCSRCYQLLGVDVILNSALEPNVIEVNGLPSIQLSHNLGVPPDPSSTYTIIKYGLLKDTLNILLNNQSVVFDLAMILERIKIGIGPGPLCKSHHTTCLDHKDLQKVIHLLREYKNRGDFSMIYPVPDNSKYLSLVKHVHELAKLKLNNIDKIRTNLRLHNVFSSILKLEAG